MTPLYRNHSDSLRAGLWPSSLAVAVLALTALDASAASSTWTQLSSGDASGSWDTGGNWAGGVIADGAGFTADFSTLNITATSTVTLDSSRTIGSLIFNDATTSSNNWVLNSANDSVLTLSGGTPTFDVAFANPRSVTVNAQIAGTEGLTKTGAGKLILNAANTYTGTLTHANFADWQFGTAVTRGRLVMGNASAVGTGDVLVAFGAGTAIFDLNGHSVSNNFALREDAYLQNSNTTTASVVSGKVQISNYARIGSVFGDGLGTVQVDGVVSGGSLYTNYQGGLVILNGANTNTFVQSRGGTTTLGVLRAQDGVGVSSTARLEMFGGVLESSGTFTRSLGNGNGQVRVGTSSSDTTPGSNTRSGGFSAHGGALTVAIGGTGSPTALTWGDTGGAGEHFSPTTLVLNAATANNKVTFVNAINLNGADRTVAVHADTAEMSGNLSNASGTAGLIKTGVGKLILSGTNTYNGTTTISAGTLQASTASLPGAVVNNAALVFDQANDGTFGSEISGTGSVEKTGAGVLTVGAANTYSGLTTISAGTLLLGNATALGTSGSAANGTIVASGGALDLNGTALIGERITIAGAGSGSGAVFNNSGTSARFNRLGLTANATIGGSGRIDVWGSNDGSGTVVLEGGVHTLTKTGTGMVVINGGATTIGQINVEQGALIAVNTSTPFGDTNHGTSVSGGASLQFYNGSATAMSIAEDITLADNAELASTRHDSANELTLSGTISLASGSASIRTEAVGTGLKVLALTGVVSGNGGFEKKGAGTLLLSATNTFSGTTRITAGTLKLASTGSIADSEVIINNATFDVSDVSGFSIASTQTLQGSGTVLGDVQVAGLLSVGNSPGSMTFTDNLELAGTTRMEIAGTGGVAGVDFDFINVLGAVTFGGTLEIVSYNAFDLTQTGSYNLFDFDSATGNFSSVTVAGTSLANNNGVWGGSIGDTTVSFDTANGVLTVGAIPEPATYGVLLGAVTLIGAALRRRRQG